MTWWEALFYSASCVSIIIAPIWRFVNQNKQILLDVFCIHCVNDEIREVTRICVFILCWASFSICYLSTTTACKPVPTQKRRHAKTAYLHKSYMADSTGRTLACVPGGSAKIVYFQKGFIQKWQLDYSFGSVIIAYRRPCSRSSMIV